MKIKLKILPKLTDDIRSDLIRPHAFAAERVGFLFCRAARISDGIIILAHSYQSVEDEDYIDDRSIGAMMGPGAIRKALQFAFSNKVSVFHIHLHDYPGHPRFSSIDLRENAKFVPDFFNVQSTLPHGAIVLSPDSIFGLCWRSPIARPVPISEFIFVGSPIQKETMQ